MNTSIINLSIDDIKPYHKNAKKHPKDQIEKIANSILEFGFNQPIVVDKDNVIIVGHGRFEAGKTLGLKEVPAIILGNVSKEQADAYRLADNKLNESDWDKALVIEELKELDKAGFDIELTGFSRDMIMSDEEKDDEVPETPEEPKSKLGDLYELGNHFVVCGDCTDESVVNRLTKGIQCDISFTSPPYNAGFDLQTKRDSKYIHSDERKGIDYQDLISKSTRNSLEYAKDVFVNLQFLAGNKKEILIWLAELADNFKDIFFWKKQTVAPAMAENVSNSQVEVICLFGKDNNSRSWGNKRFRGTFSNHLETKSASGENKNHKIHSATFPVELPLTFLKQGYNEKSNVLDLFAGTGTTMIACEKLGMKCYMVDIEPAYVDVIIQRYVDYTGNTKIKKNGVEIEWAKTKDIRE